MKKCKLGFSAIIAIVMFASLLSCNNDDNTNTQDILNISVYLDLSDRLIKPTMTPSQTYRDTSIINYLVDYFIKQTMGPQILSSQNKMKIFFYPTPNNSDISTLAAGLSVDIGSKQGLDRRKALDTMKCVFQNNLSRIYEETIKEEHWIGSDIWRFFSDKKIDQLCVKPNARNIVVILTDGYIFAEDNMIDEGCSHSYINNRTLAANDKLIDRRHGDLQGKGIEVLMLEINPGKSAQFNILKQTLEDWFVSMGIEQDRVVIAETDANITNTKTIIDNFLKQN